MSRLGYNEHFVLELYTEISKTNEERVYYYFEDICLNSLSFVEVSHPSQRRPN